MFGQVMCDKFLVAREHDIERPANYSRHQCAGGLVDTNVRIIAVVMSSTVEAHTEFAFDLFHGVSEAGIGIEHILYCLA